MPGRSPVMPDDSACQHSLPLSSKSRTKMLTRHQLLSSQWVTTCATPSRNNFGRINCAWTHKQQRFEYNHGTCIVSKSCTMSEHAADSGGEPYLGSKSNPNVSNGHTIRARPATSMYAPVNIAADAGSFCCGIDFDITFGVAPHLSPSNGSSSICRPLLFTTAISGCPAELMCRLPYAATSAILSC